MGFITSNVYLVRPNNRASLPASQLLVLILVINVAIANNDTEKENNLTPITVITSFTSEKSSVCVLDTFKRGMFARTHAQTQTNTNTSTYKQT